MADKSMMSNSDQSLSSSLFREFSVTLDKHTKALEGFVKDYEAVNDLFLDELSKVTKNLGGSDVVATSRSGGKSSSTSTDKSAKTISDATRDMSQAFERSDKNTKTNMTKMQAWGQLFWKTGEKIIKLIGQEYRKAFDTVRQAYMQDFSRITARESMSRSKYAELTNSAAKNFQQSGLHIQFSSVDFLSKYAEIQEVGLRGQEASDLANRSLIAQKLVPALNTTSKGFVQSTKNLGNGFSDAVVAMSKYTEGILGAQGLEEGQINNIIDTISTEVSLAAGSQEEASQIMERIIASYQTLANTVSPEAAEQYLADIKTQMTAAPGEGVAALTHTGYVDADTMNAAFRSEQGIADLTEKWMSFYADYGGGTSADTVTMQAFGMNSDVAKQIAVSEKWGRAQSDQMKEQITTMLEGYDREEVMNKENQNLQDGYYQTMDDQMTKSMENQVTSLATASEQIARLDSVFSILGTIASSILTIIALQKMNNLTDSLDGLDDLGKGKGNFFNKIKTAFKGDKTGSGIQNLSFSTKFMDGMKYNQAFGGKALMGSAKLGNINAGLQNALGTTGGTGFGGASTAAGSLMNFAAGPGALIAGGIWAAKDAWDSGSKAAKDGKGAGDVALQSLRGAITGGEYMTKDEQNEATNAALAGQKRKMDWGKVGANAGKGALIGAGVGTAAGGWAAGLGTAIGAGVGAITGAVTSMIDQAIENAKYNQLADAVNEQKEVFEGLTAATDKYNRTVEQGKQSLDLLKTATAATGYTQEQQEEALAALQEMYPEQLGAITSLKDLDERYVTVLQNKIDRENALAEAEMAGAAAGAADSIQSTFDELDDITAGNIKSEAALDFVKAFGDAGGENMKDAWSSEKINEELDKQIAAKYGFEKGSEEFENQKKALIEELNSGESGDVIKVQSDGRLTMTGQNNNAGKGGATAGDNAAQFAADYADSSDKRNQVISAIGTATTDLSKIWTSIESMAGNHQAMDEDGNPIEGKYSFGGDSRQNANNLMKQFEDSVKAINDQASEYGLDYLKVKKDDYKNIDAIWEGAERTVPSFKLGKWKVPWDNYPAWLHAGEMVLPSAQSEMLRKLASGATGGVTGLLSSLLGVGKTTTVAAEGESVSQDPVSLAIATQTETLSSILNQILDAVLRIVPEATANKATAAQVSENVTTYHGA